MNEIMVIADKLTAMELFHGGRLDEILHKIERQARSVVPDLSTKSGREQIASIAYSVARKKTIMDKQAKSIVEKVGAERRRMRDRLDALKSEIRKPLDEWEKAEANRKKSHEDNLALLRSFADVPHSSSSYEISIFLDRASTMPLGEHWEEYSEEASELKDRVVSELRSLFSTAVVLEREREELLRLRKEKEERDRIDMEAREAQEAKELAAREEQRRIDAERKEIEQAKRDAEEAEIRHQQELKQAEERAKREAEEAVERERQRVKDEEQKKADDERKRENDKAHRIKVNDAAVRAIADGSQISVSLAQAAAVVNLIESGRVPNVNIVY